MTEGHREPRIAATITLVIVGGAERECERLRGEIAGLADQPGELEWEGSTLAIRQLAPVTELFATAMRIHEAVVTRGLTALIHAQLADEPPPLGLWPANAVYFSRRLTEALAETPSVHDQLAWELNGARAPRRDGDPVFTGGPVFRWARRFDRAAVREGRLGHEGFLDAAGLFDEADADDRAMPIWGLLARGRAVLIGDPWTGKTTVGKRLVDYARARGWPAHRYDCARSPEPLAWQGDFKRNPRPTLFVIDSVEEALHRKEPLEPLLGWVDALDDRGKAHLYILLLSRPDSTLDDLDNALEWSGSAWEKWALLPPSRRELEASFVRANQAIARLSEIGLRHRVTEVQLVRTCARHLSAPRAVLERRVLDELLGERAPDADLDDALREAVARLAVVTLLADKPVRRLGADDAVSLIEALGDQHRAQRDAVGALVEGGCVLVRDGEAIRFGQRYEQELFAAHALEAAQNRPLVRELLRPLFTAAMGGIRPELEELHRRLLDAAMVDEGTGSDAEEPRRWKQELETWRTAEPHWVPPAKAREILDELHDAALAATIDPYLHLDSGRLAHPSLAPELENRIGDATRSDDERAFLLWMSELGGRHEVVEAAIGVAARDDENRSLRRQAVRFVEALGDDAAKRKLLEIHDADLRTTVLDVGLRAGLISVADAIREARPANANVLDADGLLISAIRERLDDEAARFVLDEKLASDEASAPRVDASPPSRPNPDVLRQLEEVALLTLLASRAWSDADAERLAKRLAAPGSYEQLFSGEVPRRLFERARDDDAFRRSLALRLARKEADAHSSAALWLRLVADGAGDVEALLELARGMRAIPHHLCHWLHQRMLDPALDDALRASVRTHLEAVAPEATREADEQAATAEREFLDRQRALAEAQERRALPRHDLAETVTGLLETIEPALDEMDGARMDRDRARAHVADLGWLCFAEPAQRPRNVRGDLADLPMELVERLYAALARLIPIAAPTLVPRGATSQFPAAILFESAAFVALFERDRDAPWLDESVVTRWLPSVLFGALDARTRVLDALFERLPAVTATVVASQLRLAHREHGAVGLAAALPGRLWQREELERAIRDVVLDRSRSADERADLLRRYAIQRPDSGHRLARRVLEHEPSNGNASPRPVAIAVIIETDFDAGWNALERELASAASDGERTVILEACLAPLASPVLRRLHRLEDLLAPAPGPTASRPTPPGRSPTQLARVVTTLFEHVDLTPDEEDFFVRSVRPRPLVQQRFDEALSALLESHDATASEVRSKLQQVFPALASRIVSSEASRRLHAALDAVLRPIGPPRAQDVVDALERCSFYIRDAQDLFYAVRYLLDVELRGDLKHYGNDFAGAIDAVSSTASGHAAETALQALVLLWLRVRLDPLRSVRPQVTSANARLWREPHEVAGRKPDMVLAYPSRTRAGEVLELVIECKWSDNSKLLSDADKFVDEYVAGMNRLAGLYVVGAPDGELPDEVKSNLRDRLERAAKTTTSTPGRTLWLDYVVVPWGTADKARKQTAKKARKQTAKNAATKSSNRPPRTPRRRG